MKNNRPLSVVLIVTGVIVAACVVCILSSLALDALGLLPDVTPQPTGTPVPTRTPIAPQTVPPTPSPAQTYFEEYGGNIEVYNRIFTLTDCSELQKEFDQAEANLKIQEPGTQQYRWGVGYMSAADQRMKDIGCYSQ